MKFYITILLKFYLKISWLFLIGGCLFLGIQQANITYFILDIIIITNVICHIYLRKISEKQNNKLALMLSHDLKTPVFGMLKALEVINIYSANRENREMYNQMYTSCKYMEKMIYNLISIYKIKRGNSHLEFTNVSLELLINEVFNELKSLADERSQTFSLLCNCESFEVIADRLEIKRVLTNLIFNAIKYADKKSKIIVSIGSYDKNHIICNVKNIGQPFKKGAEKTIFNKYKRFNEKINYNSDGLGLYLCKKIIKSHHGKIFIKTDYVNTNIIGFTLPKFKNLNQKKFHFRPKKILEQLSNQPVK